MTTSAFPESLAKPNEFAKRRCASVDWLGESVCVSVTGSDVCQVSVGHLPVGESVGVSVTGSDVFQVSVGHLPG